MSQPAYTKHILKQTNPDGSGVNTAQLPHRNGYPMDTIPHHVEYDSATQLKLTKMMQYLIGSLNWSSITTHPDVATITNLLAKYMATPSTGHIESAKRVVLYLKETPTHGMIPILKHMLNSQQTIPSLQYQIQIWVHKINRFLRRILLQRL